MTAPDYCPRCGLSGSHWSGCEDGPRVAVRVAVALAVILLVILVTLLAGA